MILLLSSQKVRDLIWEEGFDKEHREQIIKVFQERLDELLLEKVTQKEEIQLQKNIRKHKEKIFFFMTTKDVPP